MKIQPLKRDLDAGKRTATGREERRDDTIFLFSTIRYHERLMNEDKGCDYTHGK